MSFSLQHFDNLHNNYVLGSRLETSLFPNTSFGRKMHPSTQGRAVYTGPKRVFWLHEHNFAR